MKIEIRTRDRRALFGLGAALLLYLVVAYAVLPAFDRLQSAARTESEKEEQLRKYRRALVRKGHYAKLLDQARKSVSDAEAQLIRGDNPSLASVEFQNVVDAAASKSGVGIAQKNVSPARKKDAFFNEITMTLSFECSPNQLTTFLGELRNGEKFVTVQSSQIAPTQIVQEPPKKGEFQKMVHVNLTLSALLAGPTPVAPGSVVPKKG